MARDWDAEQHVIAQAYLADEIERPEFQARIVALHTDQAAALGTPRCVCMACVEEANR